MTDPKEGVTAASTADDEGEGVDAKSGDNGISKFTFPVVGIGASAGGLATVKRFLENLPPDLDMAFVVILHLDPDHDSALPQLLAKSTIMPVKWALDREPVTTNTVFLIQPGVRLALKDGCFRHLTLPGSQHPRLQIDYFLMSLASEAGEMAVAIILSGTGSDGALGVRELRGAGGLALVQDPVEAEYPSMPRHALNEGADLVLPVREMGGVLKQVAETGGSIMAPGGATADKLDDQLTAIIRFLQAQTGQDFRGYKRNTLLRRAQRRAGFSKQADLTAYLEFLRQHPDEVNRLLADFRINVTSFFRDLPAWEQLKRAVLQSLVADAASDHYLRFWVAGCSTGEEAYTLAMLISEELADQERELPVQIYATDASPEAIAAARSGIYPPSIASQITTERLQQHFVKELGHYRVRRRLREMIIFAPHNMVSDPPFSRLDLVTCRNVLIYMEPQLQRKLIQSFHFGLREGGYLMLGSSESVTKGSEVFVPASKKWNIYQRTGVRKPAARNIPAQGSPAQKPPKQSNTWRIENRIVDSMRVYLLEEYAPAAALVNERLDVLAFSGNTRNYLVQPGGERTDNLLEMTPPDIRPTVRSLVQRSLDNPSSQLRAEAVTVREGHSQTVLVTAKCISVPGEARPHLLVTFRDVLEDGPDLDARGAAVPRLEEELRNTREELQSTIEEMETANEELKAANEEITSVNEELQSANEELESSKEELQSMNEELVALNTQLGEKIVQVESTTADLHNLLTSTNIAVLFLDTRLMIRRFTNAATRFFNLLPGDLGRPVSDITQRVHDPYLYRDATQVLEDLQFRESEISTSDGQFFIRRAMPYRTEDLRADGVVLTFTDVTNLKQASQALHVSEERYRSLVAATTSLVWTTSAEGVFTEPQLEWERYTGQPWKEHCGSGWLNAVDPDDRVRAQQAWQQARNGQSVYDIHYRLWNAATKCYRHVIARGAPMLADDGEVREWIGTITDVHEQRVAELERLRLASVVENARDAIIVKDHTGRIVNWNKAAEVLYGYSPSEILGESIRRIVPQEKLDEVDQIISASARGEFIHVPETKRRHKDGNLIDVSITTSPVFDEGSVSRHTAVFIRDIRESKRNQERIERLNATLEERLREWNAVWDTAPVGLAITRDPEAAYITVNEAGSRILSVRSSENASLYDAKARSRYQTYRDGKELLPDDLPMQRAARVGEEIRDEEIEVRLAQEKSVYIMMNAAPLRDTEGKVTGAVGAYMDVTQRKYLEAELRALNAQLEERVEERTTVVRQQIDQLLRMSMQLAEAEQRERRRLADMLHDHLQQLLVAAKLQVPRTKSTNEAERNKAAGQIEQALKEAIEASRSLAMELSPPMLYEQGLPTALQWLARRMQEQHGLEVKYRDETDDNIRCSDEVKAFVFGAVRELLFNVVKHAGVNEAALYTGLREGEAVLCIEVKDAGRGFEWEKVSVGSEASFGLLHLNERLRAFRGELRIESRAGQGAAFQIHVPNIPGARRRTSEMPAAAVASHVMGRPIRIVLADDHQIVREGLRGLLESDPGIEVIGEANDGEEAIWLAHALLPDVIVMDVSMPRMNGIEATKRVRGELPEVRVVALTLHEEPEVAAAMLRAGASAIVNKAAPHENLVSALRDAAREALPENQTSQ